MTQNETILKHMTERGEINPRMAMLLYGIYRLSARIHDLKNDGHDIESKSVTNNGKTFSEYKLKK